MAHQRPPGEEARRETQHCRCSMSSSWDPGVLYERSARTLNMRRDNRGGGMCFSTPRRIRTCGRSAALDPSAGCRHAGCVNAGATTGSRILSTRVTILGDHLDRHLPIRSSAAPTERRGSLIGHALGVARQIRESGDRELARAGWRRRSPPVDARIFVISKG